jgi:hypothetical protein
MTRTAVIIRWFSPLLICLVLTGCSLPLQNLSSTEETEYFAHGLDQYIASGDLTILKRLPQQYPQGEWRTKAEGLVGKAEGLVGKAEKNQARLKEKEKELEQAQKEQATLGQNNQAREATLKQEKAALVKKNQELEETLEQLKQVLIDMELKTK